MVGVCELAKILASNEAIKNEVEKLRRNIEPGLQVVDIVSSPELGAKINKCMRCKERSVSFKGVPGITENNKRNIKYNITLFKNKYYSNNEIEIEKDIVNCFLDGRCDVYVKDKYIIEVKSGEDKTFHLIQLALYNILYEEEYCEEKYHKVRLYCYLFNPIEGYVYGGDISSLCNKIKEVVDNNYIFLKFINNNAYILLNIFNNGTYFNDEDVSVFIEELLRLITKSKLTIIMDCKDYNPNDNIELYEVINYYKDSFKCFNEKEEKK